MLLLKRKFWYIQKEILPMNEWNEWKWKCNGVKNCNKPWHNGIPVNTSLLNTNTVQEILGKFLTIVSPEVMQENQDHVLCAGCCFIAIHRNHQTIRCIKGHGERGNHTTNVLQLDKRAGFQLFVLWSHNDVFGVSESLPFLVKNFRN